MTSLAVAIGLLVAAIGIAGIVAPHILQTVSRYSTTPVALFAAAAIRIGFGWVLIRSAPASRAPRALRVIGFIAVAAGIITIFLGVPRARALADWWSSQGPVLIRLWPALALIFGVFIVYAVFPARRAS